MKKIIILFASGLLALCACGPKADIDKPDPVPPEPVDTTVVDPPVKPELELPIPKDGYKIATLWIDLTANIKKLSNKAGVDRYLDLAQKVGFNGVVLDIKGTSGAVMYDSDFLLKCQTVSGVDISSLDYDFVQYFVDECHRRNMRITLSTCIMPFGDPRYYNLEPWKDLYAVEYLPQGLVDIRTDNTSGVFDFLNPCRPEVTAYAKRMAAEIVSKYDIDGYALDYCRYMDYNSDFSEYTHKAMEEYFGETIDGWPECVYSWPAGNPSRTSFNAGNYYNKFCEFKAATVTNLIKEIRDTVKAVNPKVDLEYWASAWWPCVGTGQNWASPDRDRTSTYWWGTPDYYKTGFAKYLDIFQLGAYTSNVYGTGTESIQGLIIQGKSLIRKNCTMYGTISAATDGKFKMADACYLCLSETDGLMVFDLSHVVGNSWWSEIKKGIMKYRNEFENN